MSTSIERSTTALAAFPPSTILPPSGDYDSRLELIAFIPEAGVARRILDHLGMASLAPPLARARESLHTRHDEQMALRDGVRVLECVDGPVFHDGLRLEVLAEEWARRVGVQR